MPTPHEFALQASICHHHISKVAAASNHLNLRLALQAHHASHLTTKRHQALPKLIANRLNGIFLFGNPERKNATCLLIGFSRYRLGGRGFEEILENQSGFVGQPEYPAYQLEKAWLLSNIQQLEKFGGGVSPQGREKPFSFITCASLG
jgi:hypothetical protein